IIAGLLAGTAAIGAISYTQRSPEPIATAAINGSAAGPALAEDAGPVVAAVATPVGQEIDTLLARLDESQDENARLREDIAGRAAHVADLLGQIAAHEQSIAALEAELAGMDHDDL